MLCTVMYSLQEIAGSFFCDGCLHGGYSNWTMLSLSLMRTNLGPPAGIQVQFSNL